MTIYVKYISNTEIEYPPKNKGSIINYNLNIEAMIADGYKEFVEIERPMTNRFYHIEYVNNIDDVSEIIVYDETQEEADERTLLTAKQEKYMENNTKAKEARYNQEFTITIQEQECLFDTTEETQRDLLTATNYCMATGEAYEGWITNNGVELNLTLEDIVLISTTFKELSNVYPIWKEYKDMINEATTVEEVDAITIDYSKEEQNEI